MKPLCKPHATKPGYYSMVIYKLGTDNARMVVLSPGKSYHVNGHLYTIKELYDHDDNIEVSYAVAGDPRPHTMSAFWFAHMSRR